MTSPARHRDKGPKTLPSGGPENGGRAISKASVTSCAVISAFIDQPTTRRENRSMTAATLSQPSAVQTYVKSAIHLRFGCSVFLLRFDASRIHPKLMTTNFDSFESSADEIILELLRCGRFAYERRPLLGLDRCMIHENFPALIRSSVEIIDQHPATRPQDTETLSYIRKTIPFVEMHKHYCAVNDIDRCIRDVFQIVPADLLYANVIQMSQPATCVTQHVLRNITAYPLSANGRNSRADAAHTTANLEHNVVGTHRNPIDQMLHCHLPRGREFTFIENTQDRILGCVFGARLSIPHPGIVTPPISRARLKCRGDFAQKPHLFPPTGLIHVRVH